MKDLSIIPGVKELDMINLYALETLAPEERQFIEKINKIVEDYENEKGDIFSFNEEIKIQVIWQKYEHLKPFRFRFDPQQKMPEVFQNRTAFIIWTTWKSKHITCEQDLVKEGGIAAAKIIAESKPPLSEDIKKRAVKEFRRYLHAFVAEQMGGVDEEKEKEEIVFWEEEIFPYLEGRWQFKWEMVQKCFHCSKNAIAICDSCSPTSATGLTSKRPFCEDCIVSTPDINIVKWLVPRHEGEKEIEYALRKIESKKIKT